MPTELDVAQAIEMRCFFAIVNYLERNDFTEIRTAASNVIKAKDGTRDVYFLIDYCEPKVTEISIPEVLVKLAKHDRARIDVIRIELGSENARIRHIYNAVEKP